MTWVSAMFAGRLYIEGGRESPKESADLRVAIRIGRIMDVVSVKPVGIRNGKTKDGLHAILIDRTKQRDYVSNVIMLDVG